MTETAPTVEGIAIVGLAGRFPGANSVGEFWANLVAGRDSITRFTDEQLAATGYDPAVLRALPGFVAARGVIDRPEWFDREFFGIAPKEAEVMDPQHRVFLEVAWDALEDAGCDPAAYPGLIGVFGGMSANTYFPNFVRQRSDLIDTVGIVNAVIGNEKDFLTTRLAYKLNLRGPALNVQTACSSSLVAVCVACQNLLEHQCDVALAGGVAISFPQHRGYFFQEGGMTSPDGLCAPFDARANGTVFSSGAGVVVLKRLSEAIAEGDQIYAVIRGQALNNDGGAKVSFAAPSVDGQMEVIALAQAIAGVDPETISYVETHGTATPLGDPIELAGLTGAFRAATERRQFCAIGSVKGNIGHLDVASGIASLIKAALTLRHGVIPPSLHYQTPNPDLRIEDTPFFVNSARREWPAGDTPRRAGVSSFGIGSTNAHVVLEEAPRSGELAGEVASDAPQLLVLSAKTASALEQRARDLATHLAAHPEQSLAAVAFTLQTGRQHFQHRRAIVARSPATASSVLLAPSKLQRVQDRHATPVAFLLPGQGSQYPRMGAQLYQSQPAFRAAIDECAAIFDRHLGFDLRALLFSEAEDASANLRETRRTQPAIFTMDYAVGKMWIALGIQPAALVGHSVGEFAAATLAGVFTLADAARLVATRARLVHELPPGAMLAVRLAEADAREFLADPLVAIAAVNSPRLCVLSGPVESITAIQSTLQARNVAARRLATSHAFHSPLVAPAVVPFFEAVRSATLQPAAIPIISTVTGAVLTDALATDPQYWSDHLLATVRFADAVGSALADERGFALLECGPGQALTQLAAQHTAKKPAHEIFHSLAENSDEDEAIATALARLWLAGATVDWTRLHAPGSVRKVSLPGYPFERQRYFADLPPGAPMPLATSITDGDAPHVSDAAAKPLSAPASVAAPDVSAESAPRATPESSAPGTLDALKKVLGDLSGLDLAAVPGRSELLELGFDSLFLSQAAIAISRKFAVKVSFRQLLQDTKTLDALVEHIDHERGGAGPLLPSTPAEIAPKPAPAAQAPAAHGPYRPVQRDLGSALTERQEKWLAAFIDRYNARTGKSKHYTQEHRAHFADPRAVSGFKQVWKEMVYPIVVDRSAGAKLWDLDGNEWLDITLGYGVAMLGHQPQFVVEAITAQLARGMEIGPTSPLAGEVAKLMCEFTGMERVTFCNTGSEAITGALRIARTVTGRPRIVYFADAYHGIDNEVLGRRAGATTMPVAPGIPPESVANALVLDYGDPQALETIAAHAQDIAAVMVEPVQSRRPSLIPRDFLHALRALTEKHGIALIFDEVVTGFRCHQGGAQAYFGIRADIATYGKVMGGGFPIGAIAGRAEYMDAFDGGAWQFGDDSFPSAAVTFFAGTFVRYPLALAAARAVLGHLREQGPQLQETLARRADGLIARLSDVLVGTPFSVANFTSNWYLRTAPDFKYSALFFALLRQRGIHVWEGRPCFVSTAHTDADLDRIVAAFRESVAELAAEGFFRIEKPLPPGEHRLTESQRELWVVCQHSPMANAAFNETWTLEFTGALDVAAFRAAVQAIVDRHDALRATFRPAGETLVIAPRLSVEVPLIDLTAFSPRAQATEVERLSKAETARVFDLERGPLIAPQLVKLAADRSIFIFSAHHLAADGWSCDVFLSELAAIYSASVEQRPHGLPPAMQMTEFARWEEEQKKTPEFAADTEYWLGEFRTVPPPLEIRGDRPHPGWRTYAGSSETLEFPGELTQALTKMGAAQGATFFTVLLAGFTTLLHRITGQTDLVVGIPSAGQNLVDGAALIGHCVNMLPIRTQHDDQRTLSETLKAVQGKVIDAFEHQRVTFGWLLQQLSLPRTPGRVPLVPVTFNLDPPLSHVQFAGLKHQFELPPRSAYQFDLGFNCDTNSGAFRVVCNYNADIFDAATVRGLLAEYRGVLASFVPELKLPEPTPAQTHGPNGKLAIFTDNVRPFPDRQGVHQLFEEQVRRAPEAVAIVDGARGIRYTQLNAHANRLARMLVAEGVTRGQCVGIRADRTVEFFAGVLGILKTGAAYVPIDPAIPAERLQQMLRDAGVELVLRPVTNAPGAFGSCRVLDIPALTDDQPEESNLDLPSAGEDLAYVMFTSGSTGTPKGTAIPHRGISRLVLNTDYVQLTPTDGIAQASTVVFDAATFEIWGAWLNGARLVLTPREVLLSAPEMEQHIRQHGITTLFLTPALFHQLARTSHTVFSGLKQLLVGGDVIDPAVAAEVLAHGRPQRMLNAYGPTETTTFATWHEIAAVDGGAIPIGRPIANTSILILDEACQPVPLETEGQIHIGGPGVALGYLGAPALTAERFIETAHGRLYRTGDLGRARSEGAIEFLGRADRQVKLRGFRIEPGEIEAALKKHPGVRDVCVMIRKISANDPALAAYMVVSPGHQPSDEELREFLLQRLPPYMIPEKFERVPSMPLNGNGKIDQQALAALTAPAAAEETAPRNEIEREVARIWEEILGRNSFSIHDDFFTLGGHSFRAIQFLSKVRERFGVDMPVRAVFEKPTVAGAAAFIAAHMPAQAAAPVLSLVAIQRGDERQRPFFLVPGGWGGEVEFLVYAALARHMDPSLPLYGLKARGSDGNGPEHDTVAEMAQDYLAEIRTRQPHGPYLLGGECVGGVVAYEMACLLEEAGEKVDLLALLATQRPTPQVRDQVEKFCAEERATLRAARWEARVRQPLHSHLEKLSKLPFAGKVKYLWQRVTRTHRPRATALAQAADSPAAPLMATDYPNKVMRHDIRPYGGKVTLLIDEESRAGGGMLGWESAPIGSLEVHFLQGNHLSYIRENAALAAAKLTELLNNNNKSQPC